MELSESAFGIQEELMDQNIDSSILDVDSKAVINGFVTSDISVSFSSEGLDKMISDTKTFGNYGTYPILDMSHAPEDIDMTSAAVLTTRQILSSLLFKPKVTRTEILFPYRFEGVIFCYLDPDMFKVSNFGDPDGSTAIESTLKDQGVAVEYPPGSEDFYIIKSGGNEDASSIVGLNVSVEPILEITADIADTDTSPLNPFGGDV